MVTRSEPESFMEEEKVAYTQFYTYLGVTFTGPHIRGCLWLTFSWICNPWCSWQTMCTLQIQESQTKLWLFDTLVAPTLLYWVETWEPSLNKANHWKDLERPLVSMIACMIRNKAPVHHDIIQAQMRAAPKLTKALFQSVTIVQRIWELLKKTYSRLAFGLLKQLAENGENPCWYAEMQMVPVTW